MNEINEVPKTTPKAPPQESRISPQALEKLSKGDIRLSPDMVITGEGEERKLHIIVKPDDPLYVDYQISHKLSIKLIEDIHRVGDKGGAMNQALDNVNKFKKGFLYAILSSRIFGYVESARDDILTRYKEIPDDGSPEPIKRIEQFASEASDLIDLVKYMQNLVGQKKFEVILPEQKQD